MSKKRNFYSKINSITQKYKRTEEFIQPSQPNIDIKNILHPDELSVILQFLPRQEAVDLAATNKSFTNVARSCKSGWRKQIFLRDISQGQEDKVSDFLNKSSNLKLLMSSKFGFTDYSGRFFHNITGFQIAFWGGDLPMRDLLANDHMSKEEVAKQIRDIEENGIDYTISREDYKRLFAIAPNIAPPLKNNFQLDPDPNSEEPVTLNEKCYYWGFRVLQAAWRAYIDAYERMIQNRNIDKAELRILWSNIAFAAKYLPVRYINAICSEAVSFRQVPDFDNIKLGRKSSFYSWYTRREHDWFREYDREVLENFWAVIKYHVWSGRLIIAACDHCALAPAENLAALTALFETITIDNRNFSERVLASSVRYAATFS